MVHIPYKGSGPALNDLVGGQVQLMFPNMAAVTPHLKSGKLRALAVTTAQPSPLAPGLSTVAASGLPGYESALMNGMFAPAKTPAAIANRLNQETVRFLNSSEAKERFFNSGLDSVGSSPEQLAAAIKSEVARMGKVIEDAGIREELGVVK
jgi:tripartite-type tricarboxylate transporter receptor subunit TctC